MRLQLDNFQSISHADITFDTGITCIQGCSASGKSALLRAIKALLLNPNSTKHYIKEGNKATMVTVESNGNTLTWIREKATSSYVYRGETYEKASKQSSTDFCDLGFIISPKGKVMNILDEWDVLFPFGESDTELFKIFEDLFSIADSAKIIDSMKSNESDCNKNIANDKNSLNNCKAKAEQIDAILNNKEINQVEIIIKVLKEKQEELDKLYKNLHRVELLNSYPNEFLIYEPFNFDYSEVTEVLELEKQLNKAERQGVLGQLVLPDIQNFKLDMNGLDIMQKAILDYKKLLREEENAKINILVAETDLKELKEQYAEIRVCPLCGQPIEKGKEE